MEKIYLSIVIPCYNEERNIRLGALESVAHFLNKQNFSYEVLLVDDGSTDDSRSLINRFIGDHDKFHLLRINHQGKASAVTKGVLSAKGENILFTDLDQATPIDQLDKIIPWLKKGYKVIIGSRNTVRRGAPFTRRAMALGFIFLRNFILNLGIRDTQCGFKVFTKDVTSDIFNRLRIYNPRKETKGSTVTAGFDVELLFIAKMMGYKIVEVPVEWHYQETRHVNPIKDSVEGLLGLLKIKIANIRGQYR